MLNNDDKYKKLRGQIKTFEKIVKLSYLNWTQQDDDMFDKWVEKQEGEGGDRDDS